MRYTLQGNDFSLKFLVRVGAIYDFDNKRRYAFVIEKDVSNENHDHSTYFTTEESAIKERAKLIAAWDEYMAKVEG